jgi:hypothetical protein
LDVIGAIAALAASSLAAMGRLPRTLLLALLALALQPATALGVDGDGQILFKVPLQANHGLSAELQADEDEIELTLKKGPQQAIYFSQGEVTPTGIAVKFGRFGEFVVGYQSFRTLEEREPVRGCEGEPWATTEGYFRGTLRFRGERNYVQIEASRVKGTLAHHPEWTCDSENVRASQARARKADGDEATLVARSRRDSLRFGVFGSREKGERPSTFFFAVNQEVREGIGISRFTFAGTRSPARFQFDHERGTAFVDPPAPFAGSARYLRRPNAPDRWAGSLTVPLLGLGRTSLVGPSFKALMVPRLPRFE